MRINFKNLTVQVLIAIVLGIIVGATFPEFGASLKILADIFIKLIKMLIASIIFLTVVIGIGSMGDVKKVGKIGGKALLYFEIVSTFALAIGLLVVNIVQPGKGFDTGAANSADVSQYTQVIAEEQQVIDLINGTVEHYGRLDWAHNNAGIGAPSKPIGETDSKDWDRCIQVTTTGMYYALKHQVNTMVKTGGGAIVNTASTSGLIGTENLATYSAAKWAVNGLTKSVALEYAKKGIRVNSICPGMTLTPAVAQWAKEVPDQAKFVENDIPLGRMGKPEDQANAAVFLCSDQAAFITGVNLPVDGGQMAK